MHWIVLLVLADNANFLACVHTQQESVPNTYGGLYDLDVKNIDFTEYTFRCRTQTGDNYLMFESTCSDGVFNPALDDALQIGKFDACKNKIDGEITTCKQKAAQIMPNEDNHFATHICYDDFGLVPLLCKFSCKVGSHTSQSTCEIDNDGVASYPLFDSNAFYEQCEADWQAILNVKDTCSIEYDDKLSQKIFSKGFATGALDQPNEAKLTYILTCGGELVLELECSADTPFAANQNIQTILDGHERCENEEVIDTAPEVAPTPAPTPAPTETGDKKTSLSGGVVFGIVFGSLIGAVLIFLLVRKLQQQRTKKRQAAATAAYAENDVLM